MKHAKTAILGAMILAAAALLAVGPRGGRGVPPGCVVVDYWEKWTGTEAAQMKQIVDDFNNSVGRDRHIHVRYLSMSSVNQKTLVATAAGVPPDVAGLWDNQVPQFAAMDAVEPLDALAAAHGITEATYKPVYWRGCTYRGKLYALISTPAAAVLHYNLRIFREEAAALRRAGCDPDRPPRTIDELDRYSRALDRFDPADPKRLLRAGQLPTEPGWFLIHICYWFGGRLYDEQRGRFTLTDPNVVRAYEWVADYSRRLGQGAVSNFRSGFGTFNSTQNAFLTGAVAMELQGPWMANYIDHLKPEMSGLLTDQEKRSPPPPRLRSGPYEWAAAPFPSAEPGKPDVAFCGFDVLMIPAGARHKAEAFEFMAYVNRQEVMEKLCSLHSKNSPLRRVSAAFVRDHPNPYIGVFERLSGGANAVTVPRCPILPELGDEMNVVAQRVSLLKQTPHEALREAQQRLQAKLERFNARHGK